MSAITKDRLIKGGRLVNYALRARHFRGHGVHSPFVYSLVRAIFVSKYRGDIDSKVMEQINTLPLSKRRALELASIADYCKFNNILINCNQGSDLVICSLDCSEQNLLALAREAASSGTAIVVIAPYKRRDLANRLLGENRSTTLDRFDYMILFNNHLPKQHFRL